MTNTSVFGWKLTRWRNRPEVRKSSGEKTTVLVARFLGDTNDTVQQTIRDSLTAHFSGSIFIVTLPELLKLGYGHDDDTEAEAHEIAQDWLKQTSGDVLIWGRVRSANVITLRTTISEGPSTDPTVHELTAKYDLPLPAVAKVAAAMLARFSVTLDQLPSQSEKALRALKEANMKLDELLAVHREGNSAVSAFGLHIAKAELLAELHDWEPTEATLHIALREFTIASGLINRAERREDFSRLLWKWGQALIEQFRKTGEISVLTEAVDKLTDAVNLASRSPAAGIRALVALARALLTLGYKEARSDLLEDAVTRLFEAEAIAKSGGQIEALLRVKGELAIVCNELSNVTRERRWSIDAEGHILEALGFIGRNDRPVGWLRATTTQATIVCDRAEKEANEIELRRGIRLFEDALEATVEAGTPGDRIRVSSNLAGAYDKLACWTGDRSLFELAIQNYRVSVKATGSADQDFLKAKNLSNLSGVLIHLGEFDEALPPYEEAIDALEQTLRIFSRETHYYYHVVSEYQLAYALLRAGELSRDVEVLKRSIAISRRIGDDIIKIRDPDLWAKINWNEGNALAILGRLIDDEGQIERALEAYGKTGLIVTFASSPRSYSRLMFNIGEAHALLARDLSGDSYHREAALLAYDRALESSRSYNDIWEVQSVLKAMELLASRSSTHIS